MNEILANIEGAVYLIDDVLVYCSSQAELDQHLMTVLKKLSEAGFITLTSQRFINHSNIFYQPS